MLTALLLSLSPVLAPAASAAAPTAGAPADSGLTVAPARLDLGVVAPGATVASGGWLINTSLQPITIETAKAGCGCTTMSFSPVTLAPGEAHPFTFEVKTPAKSDQTKRIPIRFTPTWGDTVSMEMALQTKANPTIADTRRAASASPVILAPVAADLGEIAVGASADASVWLVNGGAAPVRVEEISTGCGCTTAVGFTPTTVAPGRASLIRLRVAPKKPSESKRITIGAKLSGGDHISAALTARVIEAPTSKVKVAATME